MKKIFRRLACCSFLCIASIGCFDAEARVTKEVAEAVLPYLMEAAGLDGDEDVEGAVSAREKKYKKEKIQAILDMIYTDDGQQQMVNWSNYCKQEIEKRRLEAELEGLQDRRRKQLSAKKTASDGEEIKRKIQKLEEEIKRLGNCVPKILIKGFPDLWLHEYILDKLNNGELGKIAELIVNKEDIAEKQEIRISNDTKEAIQVLFPCNTDTFTSFANHKLRMGFHILNTAETMLDNLKELLQGRVTAHKVFEAIKEIKKPTKKNAALCEQLAKVIFILDICDDTRILKILNVNSNLQASKFKVATTCEYRCRPVSAIVGRTLGKDDGDCVETLYRHLINIAIQDPNNLSKLHIQRLPKELKEYYKSYNEKNGVITMSQANSESGLTDVTQHKKWQKCLRATLTEITVGKDNIELIEKGAGIKVNKEESSEQKLDTICDTLCKNGISPFRYVGFAKKIERGRSFSGDSELKTIREQEAIYQQSVENVLSYKNKQVKFKLLCDTSTGTVGNIANVLYNIAKKCQNSAVAFLDNNSTNIQNALNTLANQSGRFKVEIGGKGEDTPAWVTKRIKIEDSVLNRTIVVGVCEEAEKPYYGHAEILSIKIEADSLENVQELETTKKSDEVSESIQTESILDSSHTNITSKHHNHSIKTIIKGEDIKIDKSTDSEIITVTKDEGKHFVNFAQDKTELKFKCISNHGGGNCFFYSISEDGQTNNRTEFIQEIKKRLSEERYKKMIVGEIAGMIETVTAITEFTGTNLSWLSHKKRILEKYKEKLQIQNKKYEYKNEFEILDLIALINDQKGQKKRKPTKTIEELETDLAKKAGQSIAGQQAIETEIANKTGKSIEEIKQGHRIFVEDQKVLIQQKEDEIMALIDDKIIDAYLNHVGTDGVWISADSGIVSILAEILNTKIVVIDDTGRNKIMNIINSNGKGVKYIINKGNSGSSHFGAHFEKLVIVS